MKSWKIKGLLLLVFTVFVFALAGCGESSSTSQPKEESKKSTEETSKTTKEKEDVSSQTNADTDGNEKVNTNTPSSATTSKTQSAPASKKSQYRQFKAKVTRVKDGDTLVISFNNKEETVRLLLVDTPESVHPSKSVQPYGVESSNFAKKTLTGKTVDVELGVGERDKYGRLLAYIYVDGKMFNETLLEKGYARVAYVYGSNTRYVDEFRAIQDKARKKEIGIWSIENYATNDFKTNDTKQNVAKKPTPAPTQQAPATSHQQVQKQSPATNTGACNIKGNVSSSGEKIYHMPGGAYYDRTKEEQMFCSTQEAEAAGFRASMR